MNIIAKKLDFWVALIAIITSAASAAIFMIWMLIGDLSILNPSSVDWMAKGDLASYHLCSIYFAADQWRWPLGLNPNYGAGFNASIAQCSPSLLFSLVDKGLTSIGLLEASQQHHGYIVLTNLVLQFVAAYLIFRRILRSDSAVPALLLALLFIQIPTFLIRNTVHLDLGAHYLILFSIYVALAKQNRYHRWFFVLLFASAFTHYYLFGMVFAIYGYTVARGLVVLWFISDTSFVQWGKAFTLETAKALASVVSVLVLFYAISGVATETSLKDVGYGFFRSDLLTFFDGDGSVFLGDLPSDPGEYEGAFYLGVGLIAVLVLAVLSSILCRDLGIAVGPSRIDIALVLLACSVITAYAMSNRISLGTFELVVRSDLWVDIGSVFRASGRFIWVPGYVLCIAAAYYLSRRVRHSRLVLILLVANGLQLIETYNRHYFDPNNKWSTLYLEPIAVLKRAGIRGIRTLQPGFTTIDSLYLDIAYATALSNLTIDQFYLARINSARAEQLRQERHQTVSKSRYDRDFAYLLTAQEKLLFLREVPADLSVFVYAVNDHFLVTAKEIPGLSSASVGLRETLPPRLVINGLTMKYLLIEGWSVLETWGGAWSNNQKATINIPAVPGVEFVALRLRPLGNLVKPPVYHGLAVTCSNGRPARFEAPDQYVCSLTEGENSKIVIAVSELLSPSSLGINSDTRSLGVALHEVEFRGK